MAIFAPTQEDAVCQYLHQFKRKKCGNVCTSSRGSVTMPAPVQEEAPVHKEGVWKCFFKFKGKKSDVCTTSRSRSLGIFMLVHENVWQCLYQFKRKEFYNVCTSSRGRNVTIFAPVPEEGVGNVYTSSS